MRSEVLRSLATRTRKMPAVAAGRRAGRPGQKVPSCIAHVLSYAVRFSGAACCIAPVLSDAVRRSGANSKRSQLFEFVLFNNRQIRSESCGQVHLLAGIAITRILSGSELVQCLGGDEILFDCQTTDQIQKKIEDKTGSPTV